MLRLFSLIKSFKIGSKIQNRWLNWSHGAFLTLSDPEDLDTLKTWGWPDMTIGERWPLEASEAIVEATNQTNIVPDIFLYL